MAFYPIVFPVGIFVGICWGLAAVGFRIVKAFGGITKKVVDQDESFDGRAR